VDYEALSMLNVSATQELARQLEQQKAENAELKARLAEQAKDLATLKVKDEARDTKLAAIEAMLSASPPATRTASLKQGAGRVE
jgi:septal ring factor EnvC (AmiA/AmiB activator)